MSTRRFSLSSFGTTVFKLRLLLILVLFPVLVWAQLKIVLKNSFIEKYKNRATISAEFIVDKAHKSPKSTVEGW